MIWYNLTTLCTFVSKTSYSKMALLLKIKKLFTKEDYDFDSPDINLRNFHPQLYIYLAAMGIFTNNRDSLLRDRFLKGQLLIHKLCCIWYIFMTTIVFLYILLMLCSLVMQSLFKADIDVIRPLLFPMWLPADDPYRTPNYELFLFFQICLLAIVNQVFSGYIYMLFHVLLHYYCILDMIIKDFEVIFDGLDESVVCLLSKDPVRKQLQSTLNGRMKRIVNWHLAVFKGVKTVSSIFGPPLVYQVMVSAIFICLMAYQVAENLKKGQLDIIFVMLLTAAILQLWIPCYVGTLLRDKGYAVGNACWNSGWHETRLGTLIRADMVLVIQRSQQPLAIKFIGLPQLQLETFSSIISTAYTYFNMLRQYNPDS
ncbi:odorant receptor 4-like isoform X2 [Galleria mellonella]|uniref:Odorant receptor n=1 Tax=Galleria mellonella TaxID=7137 RepID=A0A6J3C0D5_GALME|nr:odorant receptor 4-like isoform X2 [Galleria mellonella]